jgi:tRNA(Ile)-lysidine synthase
MQKILNKFAFKKLAIACSGGLDSMCLAYLAAKETKIVALIIDHSLRVESASEAAKTSAILDKLNIENHILKVTKKLSGNLQEQARLERYKLLTNWCKKNGYDALATAHHADDNAENFLLRLARGSGVDGLASIAAEAEMHGIKIIRPVLNFTKAELQNTLENAGIKWVNDPSNETDKYSRNKIRHALELLEDKELVTARINETAENMARVRDFLEIETAKAEKKCLDNMKIDMVKYTKLHPEIAYRLLVKITAKYSHQSKRPRFEKIKNLHAAILAGEKKTLAGLVFTPKNNKIVIALEK